MNNPYNTNEPTPQDSFEPSGDFPVDGHTDQVQPAQPAQPAQPQATSPAPNFPDQERELSKKERKQIEQREREAGKVKGSFAASTWAALIVGFLLLILLIIFILQNQQTAELNFFAWSVEWPAGVAFLIFAIAGALIMALVGGWRMFELRRQVRKQAKQRFHS